MPTTRFRKARKSNRGRVSPAAIELFRRGLELLPGRDKCLNASAMCNHTECTAYQKISRELDTLLGVPPWDTPVLQANFEGATPSSIELREQLQQNL